MDCVRSLKRKAFVFEGLCRNDVNCFGFVVQINWTVRDGYDDFRECSAGYPERLVIWYLFHIGFSKDFQKKMITADRSTSDRLLSRLSSNVDHFRLVHIRSIAHQIVEKWWSLQIVAHHIDCSACFRDRSITSDRRYTTETIDMNLKYCDQSLACMNCPVFDFRSNEFLLLPASSCWYCTLTRKVAMRKRWRSKTTSEGFNRNQLLF